MKKTLLNLVIFSLLCVSGMLVGLIGYQDVNLTSLLLYSDTALAQTSAIVPGTMVHGEFRAAEDNLAIIRVRLRAYNRQNTTHLIFRIRQKNAENWLVTNTYTLDRIPDALLYPFGFPQILDSQGNVYEFELASPDGTIGNAVGVVGGYHGMAAQYVQPLPAFIPKKLMSIAEDPYSLFYFILFLTPAFAFGIKKIYRRSGYFRIILAIIVAYMILVYVYVPITIHSNTVLFIAAAGFFIGRMVNAPSSIAFFVGTLLLLQIPIAIGFDNMLAANRLATLVFSALVVGGIMAIREIQKK